VQVPVKAPSCLLDIGLIFHGCLSSASNAAAKGPHAVYAGPRPLERGDRQCVVPLPTEIDERRLRVSVSRSQSPPGGQGPHGVHRGVFRQTGTADRRRWAGSCPLRAPRRCAGVPGGAIRAVLAARPGLHRRTARLVASNTASSRHASPRFPRRGRYTRFVFAAVFGCVGYRSALRLIGRRDQ
jgi:hypothetical protein